jgi:hypothetical protein
MKAKIQSKHKLLKAKCDKLWSEIVKIRAGYKSELSGETESLQSHHVAKKPNYFLRYCLENGICLTKGEHFYLAHGNKEEEFREIVKKLRGKDIYDKLRLMINNTCELKLIKIYLEQELKKYKREVFYD